MTARVPCCSRLRCCSAIPVEWCAGPPGHCWAGSRAWSSRHALHPGPGRPGKVGCGPIRVFVACSRPRRRSSGWCCSPGCRRPEAAGCAAVVRGGRPSLQGRRPAARSPKSATESNIRQGGLGVVGCLPCVGDAVQPLVACCSRRCCCSAIPAGCDAGRPGRAGAGSGRRCALQRGALRAGPGRPAAGGSRPVSPCCSRCCRPRRRSSGWCCWPSCPGRPRRPGSRRSSRRSRCARGTATRRPDRRNRLRRVISRQADSQ